MAVSGQAPLEAVIELLAAFPDATRAADGDGMLPLHVAAASAASAEILGQLLAVFPDSARVKYRGMRPIFHWLLEQGGQPAHDLAAIASRSQVIARCVFHDLVQIPELAAAAGALVAKDKELPYVKDAPPRRGSSPSIVSTSGREAIEVACPECRRAILLNSYLLRRYMIQPGSPVYQSANSCVIFATDTSAEEGSAYREVALKFVRKFAKLQRESDRRQLLSADFVVPVLRTHTAAGDASCIEETELRGLWPNVLVMERCQRTLATSLAERSEPCNLSKRDWEATRRVARQLAEAVNHLHQQGLVHGEVKPSNVLLVGDRWRLSDLDAAASFAAGEYISDRCSSAFCPPEMVYLSDDLSVSLKVVPERGVLEAWEPASLKASPAFDLWSFGCVLFHMVTGAPLFDVPNDALPPEGLRLLAGWKLSMLDARLRPVLEAPLPVIEGSAEPQPAESRAAAVALLRWLLQPQPGARPASMSQVLRHRFMDPVTGLDEEDFAAEGPSLYATLSNNLYSAMSSNGALSAAVAAAAAPTGAISSTLWRGMSTALAFATAGRAGGYSSQAGGEEGDAGNGTARGEEAAEVPEPISPFTSFRRRGCAAAFSMQTVS